MRVLPLVLLVAVASGCYTYTPVKTEAEPKQGTQLRFELTLTGGDSMARWLGPSVKTVDGRLVVADSESYELGVTQVIMYSGMEQYWKGETVTLPKPYVASVQGRTFSYAKTGVLAGAILLCAAALKVGGGFSGVFGSSGPPSKQ